MAFEITCPYCFEHMQDDEVLFRSDKVHSSSRDPEILPDDFDDIHDFLSRYKKPDKEAITKRYQEWDFFVEAEDAVYKDFWEKFGGTTEYNPADVKAKIKSYHRRVIDPSKKEHQQYLEVEGGQYLLRDGQGMVSGIKLRTGEKCNRRVCPHCHNPLPSNYGKHSVKFTSVIGITGSGKTIYLSQLLRSMSGYTVKAGLNATATGAGVVTFLENNPVKANKHLPGSTPEGALQQPLFYELAHSGADGTVVTETFVLYDVAGELFHDDNVGKLPNFAPFIDQSHGIFLLIDPFQFPVFAGLAKDDALKVTALTALNAIQNIINKGAMGKKITTPVAVCISKADLPAVQKVMGAELKSLLLEDVNGLQDVNGFYKTIFNAKEYAPIGKKLMHFMTAHDAPLNTKLFVSYENTAYFAFTSLGCEVKKDGEGENAPQYPVGPVMPKRIEEPLLWMFYKLGYIQPNGYIPGEVSCPMCGSLQFLQEEHTEVEHHGLFGMFKKTIFTDLVCENPNCQHHWNGGGI